LRLHALCRPEIWDSGKFKQKDVDIIETYPDGRTRIRFKSVAAGKTPDAVRELVSLRNDGTLDRRVPPLVLMAAFNLDFLYIHPFRDGNGQVSRLLLLLQCYQLGLEVGRYISLERLIEENKDRYYETLEQSSHGCHPGLHDPWPYINYLLFILERAFREFEQCVVETKQPKGAKAEIVLHAIRNQPAEFRLADIKRAYPGVGREWIRTLLADLKEKGEVFC
jgi:Fic family protein